MTCGSVWSCPVCNAKIAAVRRLEVGAAVAAWMAKGGSVIFMTRTLRHHRGHSLRQLWDGLGQAWSGLLRGAPWKRWTERLGLHGSIRVVETTHGVNGWHVHVHALLFVDGSVTDGDLARFGSWSASRWSDMVVRRGLPAPLAIGQDARIIRDVRDSALADYLSKMDQGGTPLASPDALGLELTHTQSKDARDAHSTRPVWDLLTDVEAGDADALDLWHEWEQVSRGRQQLRWSPGLRRQLLGDVPERDDEQIAAEVEGDDDLVLITADGWSTLVSRPLLIPKILEAAEASPALLREFLNVHHVEFLDPARRQS